MNVAEMMDFINNIEDDYPVDEWEAGGIKIWPIVRFNLVKSIMENNQYKKENRNKFSYQKYRISIVGNWKYFIKILISILNELFIYLLDNKNNDIVNRNADVLFIISSPNYKIDGEWLDIRQPYIDVLKEYGLEVKLVQLNTTINCNIPRKNKSVLLRTLMEYQRLKRILKYKLCKKKIKLNYEIKAKGYSSTIDLCIRNKIPTKMLTIDTLQKQIFYIREISSSFKKILYYTKPNYYFKVCYYNQTGMALNLACKELNIASADVQHGVQGEYHWAYGRWNKVPVDGYELLPRYFCCWSNKEVDVITRWCKNQNFHKAYEVGNLWTKNWVKYNNNTQCDLFNLKQTNDRKDDTINVLFTLQPNVMYLHEKLWIYDAINTSPANWKWFIRLHPGMLYKYLKHKKEILKHCQRKVEIDIATNIPLPAILNKVDVHVTFSSTCVLDAKELNVPSVVLSESGKLYYSDLIKTGWVLYASNKQDLIKYVSQQYDKKMSSIFSHFETNSNEDKFKNFINDLVLIHNTAVAYNIIDD